MYMGTSVDGGGGVREFYFCFCFGLRTWNVKEALRCRNPEHLSCGGDRRDVQEELPDHEKTRPHSDPGTVTLYLVNISSKNGTGPIPV